jgi:hypothetical protein
MSIINCMATAAVEKRTRLPIMLLVASGYFLGSMIPVPWLRFFWLERRLGYWGLVLPFAFLFYSGRDRLLDLLSEVGSGTIIESTRADEWYEKLVRIVSIVVVACVSALFGWGVGEFAYSLGLNRYVSVAVGLYIFIGVSGLTLSRDAWGE